MFQLQCFGQLAFGLVRAFKLGDIAHDDNDGRVLCILIGLEKGCGNMQGPYPGSGMEIYSPVVGDGGFIDGVQYQLVEIIITFHQKKDLSVRPAQAFFGPDIENFFGGAVDGQDPSVHSEGQDTVAHVFEDVQVGQMVLAHWLLSLTLMDIYTLNIIDSFDFI